jgi:hypothetical protein
MKAAYSVKKRKRNEKGEVDEKQTTKEENKMKENEQKENEKQKKMKRKRRNPQTWRRMSAHAKRVNMSAPAARSLSSCMFPHSTQTRLHFIPARMRPDLFTTCPDYRIINTFFA